MKLEEFETIEQAKSYEVVTDTKQVGSGQARGFFVNEECIGDYAGMKLWTLFNIAASDVTNPLFPLASAIVITASDAQSYFGMDVTKADGISNRAGLAGLVALGVMSQETADKFIAKTLSTSYPFSDVTQEEFDAAKASLLVDVTTEAHTVKYGETELDYMLKLANQDLQIFAVFDEAPPEDCVVDVFVWEQPIEAVPHTITAKTNIIRVNSGEISTGTTLTKNLKRKIKFSATCNKNFPFTLYVNW